MVAASQSGGIVAALPAGGITTAGLPVRRRLSDEQRRLIELLRECKPIECSVSHFADGRPPLYSITYRQRASSGIVEADEPLPYCNYTHQQILDAGSPVSMSVWMEENAIDCTFPYSTPPRAEIYRIDEAEARAIVEWYLP